MPIVKRNAPVASPIENAFEYIADWKNLKDFMPMFLELKPVSLVEYGPGLSLETMIALGKVEISTTFDVVEFLKNRKIVFKSARGVKSKMTWELKQVDRDKILVTFTFEFEIPPGLVTRAYEREGIEKELQDHANKSMDMLTWILQSKSAVKRT